VQCIKRHYSKCNLTLDVARERQLFRKSFSKGRLHSDFVYKRGQAARTSYLLHYANFHILFKTFGALTAIFPADSTIKKHDEPADIQKIESCCAGIKRNNDNSANASVYGSSLVEQCKE